MLTEVQHSEVKWYCRSWLSTFTAYNILIDNTHRRQVGMCLNGVGYHSVYRSMYMYVGRAARSWSVARIIVSSTVIATTSTYLQLPWDGAMQGPRICSSMMRQRCRAPLSPKHSFNEIDLNSKLPKNLSHLLKKNPVERVREGTLWWNLAPIYVLAHWKVVKCHICESFLIMLCRTNWRV